MADDDESPTRVELCARRYWWNGHSAWCLKPEGHDGNHGGGAFSGRPHPRPNFMPRKR